MKIIVFSDVHGNLPAFEKMVSETKDCDGFVCLGDLVNYGPWGNECVDLALSLNNAKLLTGNHEKAFIDRFYLGKNIMVQDFFNITLKLFSRFDVIKTFAPTYSLYGYTCIHTINDSYIYPDTKVEIKDNYFIGHSHHQFKYEYNNYKLYNTGSVGQNRKYINVINYIEFYPLKNLVNMKRLIYDIEPLISKMRELDFPDTCINYYLDKERV